MHPTNTLTYTLTIPKPTGLTELSFLLPEEKNDAACLTRELNTSNNSRRYDILAQSGLLLNDSIGPQGYARPAELRYTKLRDGRMQLTDAWSVQQGAFAPYNNDPNLIVDTLFICGFHLRQRDCEGAYNRVTKRFLFTEVSYAEDGDSENQDLLREEAPLDTRLYLFIQNRQMMNYLRGLQPESSGKLQPAFLPEAMAR